MKWNGFDTNPSLFQPVSAKEVKDDGTVLDVAAWREDTTQKLIDIKDEVNDEALAGRTNNTEEHTSTRSTITTKSDEEQVKLDAIKASIDAEAATTRVIRSSFHEQVHLGRAFMTYHNDSSMATNDTINMKISTGANQTHLVFDVHGKFDFEFKCYEDPTSGAGTSATILNKNRTSLNTSSNTATTDVPSISGGTIILHDLVSEGQKAGGNVDFYRELILKPSTDYIFELTSLSSNNIAHINLDWYEPT